MARNIALHRFHPRLIDTLKDYNRAKLVSDIIAGITVGVVALPLAMAFAIASGLTPEAGIFTAIVAGFLVAIFSGSPVQIGGPAGAFIVVVYGIVEKFGVANLLICTMMAGVLLFLMGLFRFGNLVRFIPVSIVIGFTNGIAVLIALSQIKDFMGLQTPNMPAEFFAKLGMIGSHIGTINPYAFGLALASLILIFKWPKSYLPEHGTVRRIMAKVPGTIIALITGTIAVSFFHLPVETIGSKFGGIPQSLPALSFPSFNWEIVRQLFPPTITIAILGAIESLLCARVADSMIEDRHDPNQELMGQGIANFITPLFGGFCATGTIARTVTNIRSGGVSPISGVVHAITLLLIVLIAAPLAANIPLATLSAILMFVAYNMGEWHEFMRLKHFSNNYRTILLVTFLLTVIVDLTVAVEVGVLLACLFFITRMASLTRIDPISEQEEDLRGLAHQSVEAYRIVGSLFFGAVTKMEGLMDPKREMPRLMILDLSGLLNLDSTGLETLQDLHTMLRKRGSHLILSGTHGQAQSIIHRSGFERVIGPENLPANLTAAAARAHAILGHNPTTEK